MDTPSCPGGPNRLRLGRGVMESGELTGADYTHVHELPSGMLRD
jgi:hypothetical protein